MLLLYLDGHVEVKIETMISIQEYFFNKETHQLVLQETLVDKFFEEIPKRFENRKIFDEKFFFDLTEYFEKQFGIHLKYEQDDIKVLEGRFDRPNILVLILPKKLSYRNKITNSDFINVIFHELTHLLTDDAIKSNLVSINKSASGRIIDKLYPPEPSVYFDDTDQSKIEQFLKYYLQPKEVANWAFTIAFSMYLKYNKSETTQSKIDSNYKVIKLSNKDEFNTYYHSLKDVAFQLLFQIQYFITKIKNSHNRKLFYNDFLRLVKLIDKYRSRFYKYCKRKFDATELTNLT